MPCAASCNLSHICGVLLGSIKGEKQKRKRGKGTNERHLKTLMSEEWPQWLLWRCPRPLDSHSALYSSVNLSTFELAIVKCARIHSDIWRSEALCKCKCQMCTATTLRWKVGGEAELSSESAQHWFTVRFGKTLNPTPAPVHTQYDLSLITFGTINLRSSLKYLTDRGALEMEQIVSVTLSKWIPIIWGTLSRGLQQCK